MANIGAALEKIIVGASKGLGKSQVAVNKILWGKGNTQPIQTVKYNAASGSLAYTTTPTKATPPKAGNLIESGLFNALDALNGVDLCNVITYVTTNINIKKKPRPPEETWTQTEKLWYGLQDTAGEVAAQIDKYTAYPNTLIGSYAGVGSNPISTNQAVAQSGAPAGSPDIAGTNVKKYNIYNLLQNLKDLTQFGLQTTAEAQDTLGDANQLAKLIPGLGSNLNYIQDFLASINKYSDYRNISNDDLRKLEARIAQVRSVCVTIQNLDFKNATALVGNFIGGDIRKQIQDLTKFLDPTKIIPTVKQINTALKSFISIANKIQGTIKTAQFVIKLMILMVKIFKFLIAFFLVLPLPNLFTVSGVQSTLDKARSTAENQTDSITKFLKEINALFTVVLLFVRYLLANANELLSRVTILLATLEGCEAMKDPANGNALSDVVGDLKSTVTTLEAVRDNLADYIIAFDSKTNPDSATFGKYTIRVVEEEISDRSIKNKRRRGIALDINGSFVLQSDLTFATDATIIINEVKLKLIAAGLIQAGVGGIDLAVLAESLTYLDDEDVSQTDLSISETQLDNPDNEDEDSGLGLNAFINKLKGGKRLRRRIRSAMATQKRQLAQSIAKEDPKGSLTAKTTQKINKSAIQDEIAALQANIGVKKEEIVTLYALSPVPNPATVILIAVKTKDIVASNQRIKELKRQLG